MKGLTVAKPGAAYELADNIEKPKPGKGQVLVKSLFTGLNPVDGFMQGTGLLVTSWPIVLGCDASGEVVEVGSGVTKFKVGDGIYGCTRLGIPGYSTFQEYFLMDEHLAFKRPGNVTAEQAATIGVGVLTAVIGLVSGTKIKLEKNHSQAEWIIIFGASGTVGQFAVQIAKLGGYKVLGSCSPSNAELVKSFGADATFSYRLSPEDQLKEIASITGGKFSRIYDTSAAAAKLGIDALVTHGDGAAGGKYFATTNDWEPIESKGGVEVYGVKLGEIGRDGDAHAKQLNKDLEVFIPELEKYIQSGDLKPISYEIAGNEPGFDSVLKGLVLLTGGKAGGKKVVAKIAAH